MAHWRLFYHFVWGTKSREPLLTPDLQTHVFPYLVSKSRELGALVLALNGVQDHIHVLAAVPPRVAPAEFVKRLKGASSRLVTRQFDLPFSWQEGYGVYSVSERDVQQLRKYVRAQKERHRTGELVASWESLSGEDDGPRLAGSQGERGA
jgi:putative transposase